MQAPVKIVARDLGMLREGGLDGFPAEIARRGSETLAETRTTRCQTRRLSCEIPATMDDPRAESWPRSSAPRP